MAVDTVKRNARQRAWTQEHMDRFEVYLSKGTKAKVDAAAKAKGLTRSKYMQMAIDKMLVEDGFEPAVMASQEEKPE